MRVAMLTTSYPKFPGDGTAPFIERMVAAVAAAGHTVDVVLPRHRDLVTEGRLGGGGVRFFPFFAGPKRPHLWGYASSMAADRRVRGAALVVAPVATVSAWARLRGVLGEQPHDLVHVHWALPNGPVARLAARARQLPLVVSLHGSDVFMAEKSAALGAVARWVFRAAAAVTACSRDRAERARAFGADAEVLPYGVDPADLAGGDSGEWRARAHAAPGDFLVAGLGRLVAKKGFGHLIAAVAELRGIGIPARLALGGSGDLSAELASIANRLGCPDAVRLLGDVPHQRVGAFLRAADAVVVPSVRDEQGNVDGLPNVLLEALACGRPIVASRVGGIPDVVTDERNGLLVPAADAHALAQALRRVREDPSLAARLAGQARARAEALSWDAHGSRLLAVYEGAATKARRAH
jgi:glycosyltransferase involved in cell wall biosynthesis